MKRFKFWYYSSNEAYSHKREIDLQLESKIYYFPSIYRFYETSFDEPHRRILREFRNRYL
jgi:hypothetical protein